MKVNIGNHDFSIIWDGVYYRALSQYPTLSNWELGSLIQFVEYEAQHERSTEIVSDEPIIMETVTAALANKNNFRNIEPPAKLTECTACMQKGCLTKYVCHTASLENAISIMKGGNLLSAVKARNLDAHTLKLEARNAANDPEDFFDYVMLSWGNCQAGDRLVMERTLKRLPTEEDLSSGFTPGIRFYFKYKELCQHQNACFDGYHAIKIKDELRLKDEVFAIIIPKIYEGIFDPFVNNDLKQKVHYLTHENEDIWQWSNKVYEYVNDLNQERNRGF